MFAIKTVLFLSNGSWYYRIKFATKRWNKQTGNRPYFTQHKTYAEIAQIEKIAPRDIHIILEEEKARQQKHDEIKERQQQQALSAKAYQLFYEKKKW